jgi:hypothetical protein
VTSGTRTRLARVHSARARLFALGHHRSTRGGNRTHGLPRVRGALCRLSYARVFRTRDSNPERAVSEIAAPTRGDPDRRAPVGTRTLVVRLSSGSSAVELQARDQGDTNRTCGLRVPNAALSLPSSTLLVPAARADRAGVRFKGGAPGRWSRDRRSAPPWSRTRPSASSAQRSSPRELEGQSAGDWSSPASPASIRLSETAAPAGAVGESPGSRTRSGGVRTRCAAVNTCDSLQQLNWLHVPPRGLEPPQTRLKVGCPGLSGASGCRRGGNRTHQRPEGQRVYGAPGLH